MANKDIKTTFMEEKLEVLEYFLREQGTTMEDALKAQLEKMYEKNVPKEVRKFIESKLPVEGNGQTQEGAAPTTRNGRSGRTNGRRITTAQNTAGDSSAEAAVVQEEPASEAGMSMEM